MMAKGGMSNLFKQAKKLQDSLEQAQGDLEHIVVEGSSGGGMITVQANGKLEITSLHIEEDILSEDVEMVEDMILAAVNQAIQKAQEAAQEKMGEATSGLMPNLPKGFKLPGL